MSPIFLSALQKKVEVDAKHAIIPAIITIIIFKKKLLISALFHKNTQDD